MPMLMAIWLFTLLGLALWSLLGVGRAWSLVVGLLTDRRPLQRILRTRLRTRFLAHY